MRSLVQSDVHTEMVMSVLGRGVVGESGSEKEKNEHLNASKKKWITEMLDDSVHSGVLGGIKKTEEEKLEDKRVEEVLSMIHRS